MSNIQTGSKWLDSHPALAGVYARVAPVLVIICLLASLFSSTGVFWLNKVRGDDQEQRIQDNAALLDCFDEFATALAGSLPKTREASASRDKALLDALIGQNGLGGIIADAQAGKKTKDPKKRLAELAATFDALRTADENLKKVREENPFPEAPSEFCHIPEIDGVAGPK